MYKQTFITAISAILVSGAAHAGTVMIDNFKDTQELLSPPNDQTETIAAPGTIGGSRTVTLTKDAPALEPGLVTRVFIDEQLNNKGLFSFSNDAFVEAQVHSLYDNLSNVDLTGGGMNNAFVFRDVFADLPIEFEIMIEDGDADMETVAGTFAPSLGDMDRVVGFDQFTVDLDDVVLIKFSIFSDPAARDFTATSFEATSVPVPAALPLLLGAIGGLTVLRRRNKA